MDKQNKIQQIKNLLNPGKRKKKKIDKKVAREDKYRSWEIRTVKSGMENPYMGLYVHIPFCNKKCDYCDFVSYSMDEEAQRRYLDNLKKEIDMVSMRFSAKEFNTLYIGGGTPSFVFDGFIRELSKKIFSSFHFVSGFEYTIEVNPSSVTETKLFEYMQSGVNRISIGVQCIDERVLKHVGRIQSLENIDTAFKLLHKMKFVNIGADVMIGLPHQTLKSVKQTIKYLLKQNVKHVSIYTLQIENHTLLFDRVQQGKVKPLDDETCLEMYNMVYKMLKKAGFIRYEVSNFSKPTFESQHNFKYWNEIEYLGLGVSAHSYINNYRFNNTKSLAEYIEKLESDQLPIENKEYLNCEERRTERIMLSLRMATGLDLEKFKEDFKEDLLRTHADTIQKLLDMKMITIDNGFLKITEDNFYVSNKIILELL